MRSGDTQGGVSASPIHRVVVSGDTYYTHTGTNRIKRLYFDEQVWGGSYIIDLDNSDDGLTTKTYEGTRPVVSLGFSGGTYSTMHTLTVEKQELLSSREDGLILRLHCYDEIAALALYKGNASSSIWNHPSQSSDALANAYLPSGQEIPSALKTAITAQYGVDAETIVTTVVGNTTGVTVTDVDSDALLANEPLVNATDARSTCAQALRETKSFLKNSAGDRNLDIYQPDNHASVYSFDTANEFFSSLDANNIVIPNTIIYYGIASDGTMYSTDSPTHGADATSRGLIGAVYEHNDYDYINRENSTSQADVDNKADARISRLTLSANTGVLVAPQHCSLELLDKVTVDDPRCPNQSSFTGYIFRLIREYIADDGVDRITMIFGGVEGGHTPSGGDDYKVDPSGNIPNNPDIPTGTPIAGQAYLSDIVIEAKDDDEIFWHGAAGVGNDATVTFYSGQTITINEKVEASALTLTGTSTNYLYIDTADGDPLDLRNTTTYSTATGATKVLLGYAKKSSNGTDAYVLTPFADNIAINTDQLIDDIITELKIANDAVTELKIYDGSITAGKIAANAVTTNKIYAGAVTSDKITVANLAAINANIGSITAGSMTGVTISQASGAVYIDSSGIQIIDNNDSNQWLLFKNSSSVTRAKLYLATDEDLQVYSYNGVDVVSDEGGILVSAGGGDVTIQTDTDGDIEINAGTGRDVNITAGDDIILTCAGNEIEFNTGTLDVNCTASIYLTTGSSNTIILDSYGLVLNTNDVRFYPRRTSQNAQPSVATGELRIWHDADDGKVYLLYNDNTLGAHKVELV